MYMYIYVYLLHNICCICTYALYVHVVKVGELNGTGLLTHMHQYILV